MLVRDRQRTSTRRARALAPRLFLLALLLFVPPAARAEGDADMPDGIALYAKHRPYAKTLMFDRGASRIRSAIERLPSMYFLRRLSDDEVSAIASVLVSPPNPR